MWKADSRTRNKQTWDAFDFFTVSLTVSDLVKTFKVHKPDITNTDITWGITLVSIPAPMRDERSALFGTTFD